MVQQKDPRNKDHTNIINKFTIYTCPLTAVPLSLTYLIPGKTCTHRKSCTRMFIAPLYIVSKKKKKKLLKYSLEGSRKINYGK